MGTDALLWMSTGRRCTSRDRLEFHHRDPFGRGGDHSPENLRLVCRTHNAYFAERDYGEEVMERYRRSGSRVSEPAATYFVGAEGGTRSDHFSNKRMANDFRHEVARRQHPRSPTESSPVLATSSHSSRTTFTLSRPQLSSPMPWRCQASNTRARLSAL